MTFVLIMGFDSSAKPSKIVGKTITLEVNPANRNQREIS